MMRPYGSVGDPLVRAAAMEKLLHIAEDNPAVKYQLDHARREQAIQPSREPTA
jgi:hypothetical protein